MIPKYKRYEMKLNHKFFNSKTKQNIWLKQTFRKNKTPKYVFIKTQKNFKSKIY